MSIINPALTFSPWASSNLFAPYSQSPLSGLGSVWGEDSLSLQSELLCMELAPLLNLFGGGGSSPSSQLPGSIPGSCQSGPQNPPQGFPGTIPGSGNGCPAQTFQGGGGNCCCGRGTPPASGSPAPGPNMMPSVQFQGPQASSSSHQYVTNVLPNGNVDQNVSFSNATGSDLTSIHNQYDAQTGIENTVETAANGHHAYVQTHVEGNQDISTVSGDADVTGGVNRFVVTMNGDQELATEYKNDGTTTSWTDTNSAGKTLSPWSQVSSGVVNDSETSVATPNGWAASYTPDSDSNYVAQLL